MAMVGRAIDLLENGVMLCVVVLAVCLLAQALISVPSGPEDAKREAMVAQSETGEWRRR